MKYLYAIYIGLDIAILWGCISMLFCLTYIITVVLCCHYNVDSSTIDILKYAMSAFVTGIAAYCGCIMTVKYILRIRKVLAS